MGKVTGMQGLRKIKQGKKRKEESNDKWKSKVKKKKKEFGNKNNSEKGGQIRRTDYKRKNKIKGYDGLRDETPVSQNVNECKLSRWTARET